MPIKFYNTLTRSKEEFKPIQPGLVKLYTCGPTVYNTAHIGNFRTFMFEDLLKRYLVFKGFQVTHVMNLTDVDDKTIKKATESGIPIKELTEGYIDIFMDDLKTLRIIPADHFPRATEHIPEMIALIEDLLERKHAYQASDGSIFFAIDSYPEYGRLAHLNLSEQRSTIRVEDDEYSKDNPQDFTLWKAWKTSEGDVAWDSPWGKGRPGWHIECSAMSMKYLGEHFDIHCGGVDNLFPHHENEIAQSVCGTGHEFVNYWLHSEHLLLGEEKMSKSLGNFYSIGELLEKGYTPQSLRYVLLTTHYRSKLKFTLEKQHEAQSAINRIQDLYDRLNKLEAGPVGTAVEPLKELLEFETVLDNDLDMAGALGVFFSWIRKTNSNFDQVAKSDFEIAQGLNFIEQVNSILDVLVSKIDVPDEISALVQQRAGARRQKNWVEADELRDKIQSLGWTIEDTADGTKLTPIN